MLDETESEKNEERRNSLSKKAENDEIEQMLLNS